MKISENGNITWSADDVFFRQVIVFSEKLLDEQVNKWFGEYCKKLNPNRSLYAEELEPKTKYINSHLEKKFGFTKSDFGVWIMQSQTRAFYVGDSRPITYTITNGNNEKVIFDHYNGYWYTATETGKEQGLVLFDYGDFYCMGGIFPLATYFVNIVMGAKVKGVKHDEHNGNTGK